MKKLEPASWPCQSTLGEVRSKWVVVRAAEGVALLGAFVFLGLLVAFGLDNLFHLSVVPRLVLTFVLLGGIGAIGWMRIASPLLRKPSDDAVALLIERGKPDLENRLINAVQLSRETLPDGSVGFVELVRQDAADCLTRLGVSGVVPVRLLKRAAPIAVGSLAVVVAYAVLLPKHFENALERFAKPTRFVAPITETTLAVEPGHLRLAKGEGFTVVAHVGGVVPQKAVLQVRGAANGDYDMNFRGEAFSFEVANVTADMTYRVVAGDAESETFRVAVVDPPKVERLVLEIAAPAYARQAVRREDPSAGAVRAIVGSTVRVEAHADRPLARATLRFGTGAQLDMAISDSRTAKAEFAVKERDTYAIALVDENGVRDPVPPVHPIDALPDVPPTVELREPGRDLQLTADAEVPLSIRAKDDVGLASLEVLAHVEPNGPEEKLVAWEWPDVKTEVNLGHLLKLADQQAGSARRKLPEGAVLAYCARAVDLKGQEARSRAYSITVISQKDEKQQTLTTLSSLRDRLRWILEKQKQARADIGTFIAGNQQAGSARGSDKAGLETAHRVRTQQFEVRQQSLAVLADWKGEELERLPGREKLALLVADEMARALAMAEAMERDQAPSVRSDGGKCLAPVQDKIIAALEKIVASVSDVLAKVKASDDAGKAVEKAAEEEDPRKKLEDLARKLEEFEKTQKKAIQASQELSKKNPDDFTDADRLKLDDMKATEEKWGKFLQEAGTDLSKLPPQDFSNGAVSKEAIEAASELDKAAQALAKKNVEMAVPNEQAGLELAQEITMNIERWLADAPDNMKWNMEEPTQDYDVPMADLPEELEDLVGDLIDKEEDMTEETQDVTSSYMDSLNEGAGWTAMDGPISNMSAKGITGNLQPNDQEVGGRSGEGRSGKSSGQMVEETASGKGGKPTPSRETPDPFEAGQVKDTSKDPTGGSTGGGKVSGVNQEGLRGTPPPETMKQMARLANQQAEIRDQAERLNYGLSRRNYQSDDLSQAVDLMKEMEEDLARCKGQNYAELQKRIVEKLAQAKKVLGAEVRSNEDTAAHLPKRLRDQLESAMDEEAPAEYRDLIEQYYKNLSEGR